MNATVHDPTFSLDESVLHTIVDSLFTDLDLVCLDEQDWSRMEPCRQPSNDEIAYAELTYWLGSPVTGQIDCMCLTYHPQTSLSGQYVYIPRSPSTSLSPKVPVIAPPRIEGLHQDCPACMRTRLESLYCIYCAP